MNPEITDTGPPLGAHDLRGIEARFGCTLPEPYVRFMLRNNGGQPEPYLFHGQRPEDEASLHYFLSVGGDEHTDLATRAAMFREFHDVPVTLLPIGVTMSGDVVCLGIGSSNRGQVWFWSHDHPAREDATWLLADDLDSFLATFHEADEVAS